VNGEGGHLPSQTYERKTLGLIDYYVDPYHILSHPDVHMRVTVTI